MERLADNPPNRHLHPTTGPFSHSLPYSVERPYFLTLTLAHDDQVDFFRLPRTSYPSSALTVSPSPYPFSSSTHRRRFERQQGTWRAAVAAYQLPTTDRRPGSVNGPCVRTRASGHIPPGTVTTQTIRLVFPKWLFGAYQSRLVTIRHPICTVQFVDLDLIALAHESIITHTSIIGSSHAIDGEADHEPTCAYHHLLFALASLAHIPSCSLILIAF